MFTGYTLMVYAAGQEFLEYILNYLSSIFSVRASHHILLFDQLRVRGRGPLLRMSVSE